ncbi:MAG: PDZ domain-containing protein, partial [Acidobacteria bacterium]|nr:PDZ domain-containing protein [Acidobacteriota bacterium]
MNREFQIRFLAGFLVLLTIAAVSLAWINFRKESQFVPPYDGVLWVEHAGQLVADRIDTDGPGAKVGIRVGDIVVAIDGRAISSSVGLIYQLYHDGPWSQPAYTLIRGNVQLEASPILVPAQRVSNDWLRFIALIYLGIGVYVLFRRWTAPGSTHFYIFCLVSFIFYAFKYTGKFNTFDWTIYWGNVIAWLLQPALFLHFALTFPEEHRFIRRHRGMLAVVYVPAALLLGIHVISQTLSRASELLNWQINRIEMAYLVFYFTVAAIVLWNSYSEADRPIVRQQLKWVTRGTIFAITPFTCFYAIPFLLGSLPSGAMKASVVSLGILPLTFGYAIFRYRLMDVDLI